MPVDYSKYPDDWKAIRASILARAANVCEQCGAPNHTLCWRDNDGTRWIRYEGHLQRLDRIVEVVLTISHTNHDVTDNRPENLRALCQRCHLRHDARLHALHAALTRDRKRGQRRMEFA